MEAVDVALFSALRFPFVGIRETGIMKATGVLIAFIIALSAGTAFGQAGWTNRSQAAVGKAWLQRRGIVLESTYTCELWGSVRGGLLNAGTHMHNIDLSASFNTGRLGLWNGGKFFIDVLSIQGGTLLTEKIVGDTQTVSNIEAPPSTRLYQLWYEHLLLKGKLSLLLGIHDLNSEFAFTEHGSLFINSSFGISADISQGARPSIFPLATTALRAKFAPNEAWEFLIGVYNGDPGDPRIDSHLPRFAFNTQGGALVGFESVHHFSRKALPGTLKAGYWRNTGRFEDISKIDSLGQPIVHRGNQGVYLLADKVIFEREDNRGIAGFLQLGWAPDENINEFGSYIGGGLKYTGLIPRRARDEAGVAIAHAFLSDRLASESEREGSETTLELTYKAAINDHFALQPDVQIVFNPGADSAMKNALVVGLRLEMSF
jgi:porin